MVVPSTVVTSLQAALGPYCAQSAFVEQALQQMSAPELFAAHHMTTGEFGHALLEVQVSEHQPWPAPLFTQSPVLHSAFVVHGAPAARLVQKDDGAQI
jgi:hypothetical protein